MTTDEAVVRHIAQMYQLDSTVYEIEILNNPLRMAEVTLDELSVRPLTQKDPLGLFAVKAIVTVDGQEIESGQIRLKIKKYADVLVLTDKVGRSDLFEPDDLMHRRMEVTNLQEKTIMSMEELQGCRARRNLRVGDILTSGDVEQIPDVEPGSDVQIVYSDGLCRITAPGKVMQTGIAGEYVKVKNTSSNKIIVARVVDHSAVAVEP